VSLRIQYVPHLEQLQVAPQLWGEIGLRHVEPLGTSGRLLFLFDSSATCRCRCRRARNEDEVPQCNYELKNASDLQEGTQDGTRICSVKFGINYHHGQR
jgi:hypothetical protein